MSSSARSSALAPYARAGFTDLSDARNAVHEMASELGIGGEQLAEWFNCAADADAALVGLRQLHERNPDVLNGFDGQLWRRLLTLFGASPALAEFFARNPSSLRATLASGGRLPSADEARIEMLDAVGAVGSGTGLFAAESCVDLDGANRLRVKYRELLTEVALYDLLAGVEGTEGDGATEVFDQVSLALSHLAAAAAEAALAIARRTLVTSGGNGAVIPEPHVTQSKIAVIAMGKCGARELNVVSDVDVIFVGESTDPEHFSTDAALQVSTRLASEMMRVINDPALEPPLWEVDANLRPEGRSGALVRTLGSHLAYYERWAKTWEFQALLKARALAGDLTLGEAYVEQTRPFVWSSASRDDFVGSVQRMRERVTEHIAEGELEVQLKLGPGGLRDVEFSVQLLQLVHGQQDESLRRRGTLPSLSALVAGGYVARAHGDRLAKAYRFLRVLEHRLQLRDLRRTAIMPTDARELRVLARASGLGKDAKDLLERWKTVQGEVRKLHLKIFYAPLLSAVAELPTEELILGTDGARARLRGIGFQDPDGAMRHLAALTAGSSRRAQIQRNLMPVLLHWFAEGTDPDFGLLSFRRISEAIKDAPWYLRLLRDGMDAAERLTRVLSSSRYAGRVLETYPDAVAWLEFDAQLRPTSLEKLQTEIQTVINRSGGIDAIAKRVRTIHRREILRLVLGSLVGINTSADVAQGLDAAHTALLTGLLTAIRSEIDAADSIEFAFIGMGRYGGRELGFAGDIDLLAVYRVAENEQAGAGAKLASQIVTKLRDLTSDPKFAIDLDFDLRPEGKNGPLARSLDAYQSYYARWSLTWEAQALLRARFVAGDAALGRDFEALADKIRYPETFSEDDLREVRKIKARVEAERMPQGADPKRQLKLGPGALSDVEWLIQLLQLQHGRHVPELRSVSTQESLRVAVDEGLLSVTDAAQLEESWVLASDMRSAEKLWSGRASDVLPSDRNDLEGIARILGYPSGHTTELEERWLASTRRARAVFEREFYGYEETFYPLR